VAGEEDEDGGAAGCVEGGAGAMDCGEEAGEEAGGGGHWVCMLGGCYYLMILGVMVEGAEIDTGVAASCF